jgi:Ulp1 family protease
VEDSAEAIARDQTVKEQVIGGLEIPLEAEKEKNTVTNGAHKNRDPATTGDRHTEPPSDVHRRKLRDEGQGAQPTEPVDLARSIAEKDYTGKTLALLSPPRYNQSTNIVSAYDVDIARKDLARLQTGTKLNDRNIEWMLRWWAGQVNGRFGERPSPPQPNLQLPRCYFASTYWYTQLTLNGTFSYNNVKRWTAKFNIFQQYDLFLTPIHVPARDHWILAVIDFKNKKRKKFHGSWRECLRAGFRTPVEGKRDRWAD